MLAFKTVKGAGWLIFSRLLGRGIDFFTLFVLARVLTPADFGLAALAISFVAVIDMVLEVPVTQALVRLSSIDKRHLDTGFTLGLLRSVLIALIVLLAAWPFAAFNHETTLLPLIAVLAIGPMARGCSSPAMVYFVRELGFHQIFVLETAGRLCASIVAVFIVLSGGTFWAIIANYVITSVAATSMSYLLAPYRPAFSLARLSDFAGFIGWFSVAQLISALNWQFDRFLIGFFSDKPTLGRYAIANDIAVIPTQSIIGPALQPVMAAFSQITSDPERIKHAFLKAARFAMLIGVPACIGLSLTSDLVTDLLLGPQWKGVAPLLSLLALSVSPAPYYQTLYSASLALDRPQVAFRLSAIDLCFRMVLLSTGFYFFSITGVSVARIVLAAFMFAFYLDFARRLLQVGIWVQLLNIWKILFSACVMAGCVLFLRTELSGRNLNDFVELAFVAATGAVAYFGTLLCLGLRILAGSGRFELIDRTNNAKIR